MFERFSESLEFLVRLHNMVPDWTWLAIGWTMHVAAFLLVCWHCLLARHEAVSAILWMFLSWSFPVLGPLLYVSFGINRVHDKGFEKHAADQELLAERKSREEEALPLAYWRAVHESVRGQPDSALDRELDHAMNGIIPDHPLLAGNAIEPLVTGDEAFPKMLDAIRRAGHHIHLQSFIISHDDTSRKFMDLLAMKAREGITVRVLFDRFGSARAVVRGFFRRYRNVPNMQIAGWTQANPLKRQFQVNLRNHRKILVVDGMHAFTGGINIHDENVTRSGHPPIRDYHFDIRGPMVQELQYTFMRDWHFMTGEDPHDLFREVYYPHIAPAGNAMIRLVNSGPTSEMATIADVFFMTIIGARKQVILLTPYFVPTPDIIKALRTAALRGVDVRLVVPKENNHKYAGLAGAALYEELLYAGVRVFERRPPFMHAKALIVDDTFAVVGTANFDIRSLKLNYETNLAVSEDRFVENLKRIALEDIAFSDELELHVWKARSPSRKLAENFCSLLTPIL